MGKFMIFPFHFKDIYDIIMGGKGIAVDRCRCKPSSALSSDTRR
jgi:hypothetical protein